MRVLTRFESPDGLLVLPIPRQRGEQSESHSLRLGLERAPLAPYAVDLQGAASAVPDTAQIRVRAVLLEPDTDSTLDQLRALLRRIGRGRLWMELDDGTERWCWARAEELVSYDVSHERPLETGVALSFVRLSDWYGATAQVQTETITASPAQFVVTSQGLVTTRHVELEMTALSAQGFQQPTIRNLSLALSFTVLAAATAAGQKVRVALADNLIRRAWFYDSATWSEVVALPGASQAELFALAPGPQQVEVTGATDATLTLRWYDAFP